MSISYWNRALNYRLKRRRALALTGTTAISSGLLWACGGDGSTGGLEDASSAQQPGKVWNATNDWKLADETKAAVRGGIYRGVMAADQAGNYDSQFQAPSQVPFSAHVHEFLMAKNRGPGIDPASLEAGNPLPGLAESFEISPDGMSATFTLRQGVKWHPIAPVNGRVMDMDDWRTSAERFLAISPQRVSLQGTVDHFEYPDARHMVWKFQFPYAPLLGVIWSERYAFQIVPKELNADQNLVGGVAIGTGYKILDKHQPSIAMEYRKHKDYWGGDPFIDRWHAPIIPEYANRYAQFVNGNIISFTPSAREVLQLAKDAPQTVIVANAISDGAITRLRFGRDNQKTLPWKDPRVRVAIRRAIDFKGIGEFLSNKQQFEAAGIPIEIVPMTHLPRHPSYWLDPEKGELGKLSDNYLFDVAEAKKLTTAAGFPNEIGIDYYVLPAGGVIPEVEQLITTSLGASGTFKVNVVRSANTVAHRDCRSLGHCDGLVESGNDVEADYVITADYYSKGNKSGEQAYPDPRIDAVAVAQRREMDPQKRIEYLKEFQRVVAELMPLVPYAHQYTELSFRWPWLHNVNRGEPPGNEIPEGRPISGGHLQWLDASMPNREKGAS
ncbi:MAG: hypothetical protein GEU75_01080 [Dehalococcoidia bacterium]|nr:hypothetical protein [Dehalococcoidia bacterium]